MADLRRLARAGARSLRQFLVDTGGTTRLGYTLVVFVASVAVGFTMAQIGWPIVTLYQEVAQTIQAVIAPLSDQILGP